MLRNRCVGKFGVPQDDYIFNKLVFFENEVRF